jgi:vacuolar protein sorting-associated protein 11
LQAKPYTLTVIDVTNRFIVFTTQIEVVTAVFIEFDSCFIMTDSKVMYHLQEKDLESKLNLLYGKNMFDTAVKIAKSSDYDAEGLSDIFKNYGDHLYSKGNYAGAVEQYIKTIGYLEPSYVIRRFLDSRHTQYLTDYLHNVHKAGKATTDHTTLLLNCFTRLDRIDELKTFLDNYRQNQFDIEVAISVCRKSCIEQALELAKFNNKHDHAISILIEDLKIYDSSVDYMAKISYDDAEKNVMKYGTLLMNQTPHKFIALLKKLCTDYVTKKCDESINKKDNEDLFNFTYKNGGFITEREQATPEDFIHFFNDSKQLIDYIEYLIRNLPTCSNFLYNSLIEHYLTLWKISESPSSERTGLETRLIELIKNYNQFYDENHILVLCQTYEFWFGAMLIYEKKKFYSLIVRHYLNTNDYNSLYALCKRLGTSEPTIWLHALNGLKSSNQIPATFLQEILQVIASEKLQSPLQVLEILTTIENGPNLSTVRNYFLQIFQKEEEATAKHKEVCDKYSGESQELKKNIEIITKNAIEFRSSLCDACNQPLNFPAIFFLCKHSFHQDCIRSFSETEKDCMVCRKKNSQLLDLVHMQNESRNKNRVFQEELDASHEPFSIVAKYFSKGLFNKIVLLSDDEDEKPEDINITRKMTAQRVVNSSIPVMSEGKIRLEENLSRNIEHKPQLSEGRLRFQEQSSKINSSLRQNIPQAKHSQLFERKKAEVKASYPLSSNPFGDETDEEDSKNPFKDEVDIQYDNVLNPFSDEGLLKGRNLIFTFI